ncbi:MAG TPA: hypothetical protein VMJ90_01430 [Anaerolineales bacterium]|nr:hypothetical protein [Anaerolineales bacterium]
MLTNFSKILTYINAGLYLILGALLFFIPGQFAPVFAWKVSTFMTMIIGGWCLGNAWLTFHIARRWEWTSTYASLIYFWVFGLGQLAVLIAFRDKVQTAHPIALLYILVIGLNAMTAILGIVEWARIRPQLQRAKMEITSSLVRIPLYGFVLFLYYAAFYGLLIPQGGFATTGEIFPEPLSAFTLRSFGAFFLSIALGATPFLWNKDRDALLSHGYLSVGAIIAITIGEFLHFGVFDLSSFPFQIVFLGAYLIVGVVVVIMFVLFGTGYPRK